MPSRKSPVLVGITVVLSIFVLWLAAAQVSLFVRFGALQPLAHRLETGTPTATQAIRDLVPLAEKVREEGICQGVFVKSGFTILLAALDMENQDTDYDAWEKAMLRAEAFGRHALGCLPSNGDFWLKLAKLRQATGEQPGEIFSLVRNSQLYAPAEPNVVAGRYDFYGYLTDATLTLLGDTVAADLKAICSESGNDVRRMLAAPSPGIQRILTEAQPQCVIPPKPA